MKIETEAKFRATDFLQIRKKLKALGATRISGGFEHNIAFDDKDGTLRNTDRLMRIRKDKKTTLAYKGPKLAHDLKSREEIEVEVSDFDDAKTILIRLGFTNMLVYDKRRETWALKGAEVMLDELPFGMFVEVEGDEKDVLSLAQSLGFSKKDAITKTYFELAREAGIKGDIVFRKGM